MKINELEVKSKVINLVATITSMGEIQQTPQGVDNRECLISDETGQVKFYLWETQVEQYKIGDKILISGGWCKSFEGELQISTGKFGKMMLVPPEKPE